MAINLARKLDQIEDTVGNLRFRCATIYPFYNEAHKLERFLLEILVLARKCHKKAGHYDRDALAASE
jgi:hypothetical protein